MHNITTTSTAVSKTLLGLTWVVRIATGALFVFSGLIKANDPIGFSYKLQEYFYALSLDFMADTAVWMGILICAVEIVLGALLILGFWARQVLLGLLLIIGFFTFLTFYSAYFEVVTSCGCFGDAIPLTPWQSFTKDVILLVCVLFLMTQKKFIQPVVGDGYTKNITTVAMVLLSLGFGVYTLNYLPIVDFLPYKKGNHLPSLMTLPEGAEPDVYALQYTLQNKKDGTKQVMSDTEYLEKEWWKNEDWEILGEPTSKLVKKGHQIAIPDLLISDEDGQNITESLLSNPGYSVWVVAWNLPKTDQKALANINEWVRSMVDQYPVQVLLLTAASNQEAEQLTQSLGLLTEVYYVDAVPLKSMVRSNPGVLLVKNGTVIDKWHHQTLPSWESFEKKYFSQP
jgi:uncharacterized membrane protein YphA (DoxX/SURF4 family)